MLPGEHDRPRLSYRSLLRSTAALFLAEPLLRRRAVFGALGFAAFSAFWTTMAFVLSGAPFHYGDATIGLFGLVGAAGALCANVAGRWADRGPHPAHHHRCSPSWWASRSCRCGSGATACG